MINNFTKDTNKFDFYLAKLMPETYVNNYRYLLKKEQINNGIENGLVFSAEDATLSSVKNHEEALIAKGLFTLTSTSLAFEEHSFPIEEISDLSMHGQRSIVFSHKKNYYEIVVSEKTNALKFMLLFNAFKSETMKREV